MLLVAAAFALLVGLELVSAATGSGRDLWSVVPVPDEAVERLAALAGLLVFFAAVPVLLTRPRDRGLTLELLGGAVVMPRRAAKGLAAAAFSLHPDVVSADPQVRLRDGRLSVAARVLLRPGTDVARIDPWVRAAAAAELSRLTGLVPDVGRVRFKVLRVGQLARHL